MNKVIGIILLLVVLGGAAYMNMQKKSTMVPADEARLEQKQETINKAVVPTNGSLVVEASSFKYAPNLIKVKKGERIKFEFKNIQGTHDFVIDDLGIKTKMLKEGENVIIEAIAFEKVGTYEFYCSYGNHKAMGMVGTLIVEE